MFAFRLTPDNAVLFFEVCHELQAETVEERMAIMNVMVQLGKVEQITNTPKTKAEYLSHLAKHFTILDVKSNGPIGSSDGPKE